jgi:hypothetical protein
VAIAGYTDLFAAGLGFDITGAYLHTESRSGRRRGAVGVRSNVGELHAPRTRRTMGRLPITRRCPSMCNERWMRRWTDESREGRRLWDEFERTSPGTQPEMPADEPEIKLEEREETPTVAER